MIEISNNLAKYRKIGVAVSGGADSMALLNMLMAYSPTVIHVDHGIRAESGADCAFVADFCQKKGLEFRFYRVNATEYAKENGVSIELAARMLRYDCFEKARAEYNLEVIALAHHSDDSAETVLMRILRGTGIKGLCGITEREGYIRPLLNTTRAQIDEYIKENDIPFVTDQTNLSAVYTRNFLRLEVLPLIAERFPDYRAAMARLSNAATEVDSLLDSLSVPFGVLDGDIMVPKQAFDAHIAVAKRSVARALQALGATEDIFSIHLDSIIKLAAQQSGKRLNLPFGIEAFSEQGGVAFSRAVRQDFAPVPFDISQSYCHCGKTFAFAAGNKIIKGVSFDPDKIPKTAVVRTRLDGDRFMRCNGHTKLLSDWFCDIGYPLRLRNRALLIADGGEILAVLGVEISDKIKIDDRTERIYVVCAGV